MRKITKRQFQQNFHKELENLPFTVTKHGEDCYVVTSAKDVVTSHQDNARINFIKTPMNDESFLPTKPVEENSNYPNNLHGKPLSGRKKECHVCYEETPIEFVNQHYMDKHGDI
jgi:hypothetical protein